MKPQALFGIILIVVGVLIFVYQGFSFTRKTNIVKAGPLEINGEKKETVPIPPILGGVCVVAGVAVFVLGAKNAS